MGAKITWTPEGRENKLGTLRVPRSMKTLTQDHYRFSLIDRLNRLVRAEIMEGRDPVAMAEPLMWEWDRLVPIRDPANLAHLLVMESETLHNKAVGRMDRPVEVSEMKNASEAAEATSEETLKEFLHDLYL